MARIKEKIEDFGEKIGGAKKDYYSKNGINVEDLEELNHRQLIEYTIKGNVFKKPNYEELVTNGLSRETAYFLKKVYDSFPTKFEATGNYTQDKEIATNYIKLGQIMSELVKEISTTEDIEKFRAALVKNGYLIQRSSYSYTFTDLAYGINLKKFFKSTNINYSDKSSAQRKIEETNFPFGMESWRKGYVIKSFGEEFKICKNSKRKGYYELIEDGFKSKEEAEKYLVEVIKPKVEKEKNKKKNVIEVRPQLQHIRRRGQDYRDGKDINTDHFMNTFGFRGGEFGNWNTQGDRQQNLNLAYDSLIDLASVLKISPNAVSLGNTLAIAFGSRGSGKALAHYEPGAVVINLTKLRGAGSLAHEWGHALDDYLSRLSGNAKINSYLSDGVSLNTSKIPETAKLFSELMSQIRMKYLNAEEIQEKYEDKILEYNKNFKQDFLDRLEKRYDIDINKYSNLFSRDSDERVAAFHKLMEDVSSQGGGRLIQFYKNTFDKFNFGVKECQDKIDNKEKLAGTIKDHTKFYKFAKMQDDYRSKAYWSTNRELFARAFESYVEYKLKSSNRLSDYLVYGTNHSHLYVLGRERELIFSKFDNLFENMKELDKSNLVGDNYKLVEDSYLNVDYKNKQEKNQETKEDDVIDNISVEDIEENDPMKFIDNNNEFRFVMDNNTYISIASEDLQFMNVVKFDEQGKFTSLETNIEKEKIRELIESNKLIVSENINDTLRETSLDILSNQDYSKAINEIDNMSIHTTEGYILSEKSTDGSDVFYISVYDENMSYIDSTVLYSTDDLKSLLLKTSVTNIETATEAELAKNEDISSKFSEYKQKISKFRLDGTFEVQSNDGVYHVQYLEGDNLYKMYNLTNKEQPSIFKEYELINKLIEMKPIEIREEYGIMVEKAIIDEAKRTTEILEELKKADSFAFKQEGADKHVLVTPSLREPGAIQMTYMYNGEPVSHTTENNLETVAIRLASEGFSKEDINERVNIEELKVESIKSTEDIPVSLGNIELKDLKAKGNIHVIRLNNNNLDKLKNLQQDFCTYKSENYTSVVILKNELQKALVALGFRNEEISKIPYTEFKKMPGKNHYILMSTEEFKKLKDSGINYSAFVKPNGINVVIKENNLQPTLNIIGRKQESTLGNIVYKELKDQGDMKHIELDRKNGLKIMDKLMEEGIKFSAFYKGDNSVYLALNKSQIEKYNTIISNIKSDLNKSKQSER